MSGLSPAEKKALYATVRARERQLERERREVELLRQAYSYEVRMALRDEHQTRGVGPSCQQEAKLVSSKRKDSGGGFFIGMDG